MDEFTTKKQDLNYLLFWVKEAFSFCEILKYKRLTYSQLPKYFSKLNLAISYLKGFTLNFQLKYPNEMHIIELASVYAQEIDRMTANIEQIKINFQNKNVTCSYEKIQNIKLKLIIIIINHDHYTPIKSDTYSPKM